MASGWARSLDVCGGQRVVSQGARLVARQAHAIWVQPHHISEPSPRRLHPVIVPCGGVGGRHKELLHTRRPRTRCRRRTHRRRQLSTSRAQSRGSNAEGESGRPQTSSICSNSRVRKRNWPGEISLRKARPIWAIPSGSFLREDASTLAKLMNAPWAVSGRRYACMPMSSIGPTCVRKSRLNSRGSVRLSAGAPQYGQPAPGSTWSARIRCLHSLQSTRGSEKFSTCPAARHTY